MSPIKMDWFWIPFWTNPAAMKQAPIVGVIGVGSGNTIKAIPI